MHGYGISTRGLTGPGLSVWPPPEPWPLHAAVLVRQKHLTGLVCAAAGIATAVSCKVVLQSTIGGRGFDLLDQFESCVGWIIAGMVAGLIGQSTSHGDRIELALAWMEQNPRRWRALGASALTFCGFSVSFMTFAPVRRMVGEAAGVAVSIAPSQFLWVVIVAFEVPLFVGAVVALPLVIVLSVIGSREPSDSDR